MDVSVRNREETGDPPGEFEEIPTFNEKNGSDPFQPLNFVMYWGVMDEGTLSKRNHHQYLEYYGAKSSKGLEDNNLATIFSHTQIE
jgi:hypothetical protein